MLSFGIQFGEGFDRQTILRLMETIPKDNDYEFLVIGTDPGGVACAREASLAGKKTALVKWRHYTPAEREISNLSLEEHVDGVVENAELGSVSSVDGLPAGVEMEMKSNIISTQVQTPERINLSGKTRLKKIRKTNMDLVNELFKRDHEGRKLMHNVGNLRGLLESAQNSGWRVGSVNHRQTLNWSKMMDQVMDFVMEENWKLINELGIDIIEVNEGSVRFIDDHTVKVELIEAGELVISADLICLAIPAKYKFPNDVEGATDFGVDCNDFMRMIEPPGNTLVVGGLPESLECAGILASCNFPVTVISRSDILKNCDTKIKKEIKNDLKNLGVKFLENTSLKSIKAKKMGQLLAEYEYNTLPEGTEKIESREKETKAEEFETVLFAIGTQTNLSYLNLNVARVNYNAETQMIYTNPEDQTTAPNIYAVGDAVAYHSKGFEISELAGKLLGKRLFRNTAETMDYAMCPTVMFTPTEYAFLGLSEDSALYRFGTTCIDIYHSYFKPLEFVLPPRKAQCLIKVVVFTSQDLVIGLHFYGPEAGEVIQGFATAFKFGLTLSKLRTVVGVHATKSQKIVKLPELKGNLS